MISVLLPVYNGEKYIRQSIQSILNQTYKDFEFLIIDDGSTDNTENVVKSFDDSRIKYIKKEHTGLADTLNYGLKIAKYDWVARMDADDISHPERLNEQVNLISDNYPNLIIATWAYVFKKKSILFSLETPTDDLILKKKLALHSVINHPTVLFNRNFIIANGGYNINYSSFQDYELWLRIRNDATFKIISKHLLLIRNCHDSLSKKSFNEKKKMILEAQKHYYPLTTNNILFSENNKKEIAGWREYFYGFPNKARFYWFNLEKKYLISRIRVLTALLFTYLPQNLFNKILVSQWRLKISFFFKRKNTNSLLKYLDESEY
ncbi:MAG: glycosyltransferase [Ignavibacteriales bacterium]|nr:glycosyltransferase [Ignavibacteriales bacterium]